MKLLFDMRATQPNDSGKRHGGGRYGEVIFCRMIERGIQFGAYYDSRLWFNPDMRAAAERGGVPLYDIAERSVQRIVDEEGYTRIYSCLVDKEMSEVQGVELYGTMHGLRGFETPWDECFWDYANTFRERVKFLLRVHAPWWWFPRERRKFRAKYITSGMKMVVVSEHTKYAVKAFFPEMKDREMMVFYSPNTSSKTKALKQQNKTDKPYMLLVSGNRWEKNNLRAIEAFDRLLSTGLITDMRMVVTGAKDASIYKYKIQNPEAFDFVGYVPEAELEALYAGAYLFVYPSLNEGFGYPPLEAMRYGVPVIASPLSSMAEVLDDGALFFNPFLVEEIMGRMMMMMEPARHDEFAERGLTQYLKIAARQERDLEGVIEYLLK